MTSAIASVVRSGEQHVQLLRDVSHGEDLRNRGKVSTFEDAKTGRRRRDQVLSPRRGPRPKGRITPTDRPSPGRSRPADPLAAGDIVDQERLECLTTWPIAVLSTLKHDVRPGRLRRSLSCTRAVKVSNSSLSRSTVRARPDRRAEPGDPHRQRWKVSATSTERATICSIAFCVFSCCTSSSRAVRVLARGERSALAGRCRATRSSPAPAPPPIPASHLQQRSAARHAP